LQDSISRILDLIIKPTHQP